MKRKPNMASRLFKNMLLPAVLLNAAIVGTANAGGPWTGSSGPHGMRFAAVPEARQETDRLIVKYKDSSSVSTMGTMAQSAISDLRTRTGISFRHLRRMGNGAQVLRLRSKKTLQQLRAIAADIARDPEVEYAEPDRILHILAVPNDPRYNEQWHYHEPIAGVNVPGAWDSVEGSGSVVAVIDTGYRPHVDLVDNILPGYDFISDVTTANDGDGRDRDARDPGDWIESGECGLASFVPSSWHGTHVAGTVAAATNNGRGVAGVAPKSKIVPIRALGKCGGNLSDIADGMLWAAGIPVNGVPANPNPANVLNLSLGGNGSCGTTFTDVIDRVRNRGVTVVVAAGNARQNAANSMPANCPGVITVAAVNRAGGRASYSNFGGVAEIAAPGGETTVTDADGILSTLNSGRRQPAADSYAFYMGTSMAAPHVAGTAALLYAADPNITPDEVSTVLTASARPFPAPCNGCGTGIVDAAAAVSAVLSGAIPDPVPAPDDSQLVDGVAKTGLAAVTGEELHFSMQAPAGATSLQFNISGGTGDADLYVKFGSAPTVRVWDYRPYRWGNNETVTIRNVRVGTYYVMLRAYRTFSGVSLVGDIRP